MFTKLYVKTYSLTKPVFGEGRQWVQIIRNCLMLNDPARLFLTNK